MPLPCYCQMRFAIVDTAVTRGPLNCILNGLRTAEQILGQWVAVIGAW